MPFRHRSRSAWPDRCEAPDEDELALFAVPAWSSLWRCLGGHRLWLGIAVLAIDGGGGMALLEEEHASEIVDLVAF